MTKKTPLTAVPVESGCVYSDIDMVAEPGVMRYSHRDGTPYPPKK